MIRSIREIYSTFRMPWEVDQQLFTLEESSAAMSLLQGEKLPNEANGLPDIVKVFRRTVSSSSRRR